MKIYLSFFFTISALVLKSQNISWASNVVEFSSEFSATEFSASQVIGPPNSMTPGDSASNAWKPKDRSNDTFITVSFEGAKPINQVLIAQSSYPGGIKKIIGLDRDNNSKTLLQLKPINSSDASGYFHQFIPETEFDVVALRVEIDATISSGVMEIDAIGVGNSDFPITIGLDQEVSAEFGNYTIHKLGSEVNTEYVEHNPIVSLDGKTLYFSRQKHPDNIGGRGDYEDIWFSNFNESTGKWDEAQNIGAPLNNSGPNFISSISLFNGKEVAVLGNRYEKKGRMTAGVSMAYKTTDGFSDPFPIEIMDDYNMSDKVDYFLVHDGSSLLISEEREDSFGKRDLYVSFPIANTEKWSVPMNLGEQLNSVSEDESPFLDYDGKTLYFSSKREGGYGGEDIYRAIRLDSTWTSWSEPENLGPKINGEGNEEYLSLSSGGENLYYTRSEKDGNQDIYDVNLDLQMVVLTGLVVNDQTNEPLGGVDVFLSNSNGQFFYVRSDQNGNFENDLPAGTTWIVSTSKSGFEAVSFEVIDLGVDNLKLTNTLRLMPITGETETRNPLILTPEVQEAVASNDGRNAIIAGATLTDQLDNMNENDSLQLHHVYFDLNSSYLRPESRPELMELASFLIEHIDLKIELSAHTDSRQTHKYNQWMSDRRAKRVADYLKKFGVEENRIVVKGYGETRLVNDCSDGVDCSDDLHQQNRRTEIKILKKG